MSEDTRYPYTYACDLIRIYGGYGVNGTNLSRSDASQIRELFSKVLRINDKELAEKLADYYKNNEDAITKEGTKEFNSAIVYHNKLKEEGYE